MKPETEAAIRAHAVAEYPRECCGLVVVDHGGDEIYFPCRNVAPPGKSGRDRRNDHFVLSKADQGAALDCGEVVAVVHSHPDWPAAPTQGDLVSCEESALPWHIVRVDGADGEVVTAELVTVHPSGYRAPLLGREFFHGVLDCYALIRDWLPSAPSPLQGHSWDCSTTCFWLDWPAAWSRCRACHRCRVRASW
ncbi:C40 family peptidase [Herbaspirillum seropedicae]|uniref:C40 family peptidase n=1 Tax=Herbaspirillum seropedicae TaxID=964 RepID=UPI003F8D5DE5